MSRVYVKSLDKSFEVEEYLKLIINYHWLDFVRMSIQYNISVKQMIKRVVDSGGLLEINKDGISVVVNFIDYKLWKMRDEVEK